MREYSYRPSALACPAGCSRTIVSHGRSRSRLVTVCPHCRGGRTTWREPLAPHRAQRLPVSGRGARLGSHGAPRRVSPQAVSAARGGGRCLGAPHRDRRVAPPRARHAHPPACRLCTRGRGGGGARVRHGALAAGGGTAFCPPPPPPARPPPPPT